MQRSAGNLITVPEVGKTAHAALGFRAHSGWAAVVVVAGTPGSTAVPSVIDRRRIEIVASGAPAQPYHAAAEMDLKEAEKLVRRSSDQAARLAETALRAVIDDLGGRGHRVAGCGIVLASGRPLPALEATLASHALIHTAEGELFRDALVCAGEACGLRVTGVRERELYARCAAELRLPLDHLKRHVVDLGRALGPPWRQDQKDATLVAWLALAGASGG